MSKVNVLVASGSVDSLKLLGLDDSLYKITFVSSSRHVISQISKTKFDLIFLDNELGKMDNVLSITADFKNSLMNKHTTVICFGVNNAIAISIANALRPKSLRLDPKNKEFNKLVSEFAKNAGNRRS